MGDYDMAASRAFEAANIDYQAALIRLEAAEMERERAKLALDREKALHAEAATPAGTPGKAGE